MSLTTCCTLSTFTHHFVSFSSHHYLAAACSVTFISHLLPASVLAAAAPTCVDLEQYSKNDIFTRVGYRYGSQGHGQVFNARDTAIAAAAGGPVDDTEPRRDGAPNAQHRLAFCFLRHTALQHTTIMASGLQEATVLFVGVAKFIQDKDVSGVFMASVCKIFTSDIRVRCSCTPCNQEARRTAEDVIMELFVRLGDVAEGYTDAQTVLRKFVTSQRSADEWLDRIPCCSRWR